jgi:hypothetical protein
MSVSYGTKRCKSDLKSNKNCFIPTESRNTCSTRWIKPRLNTGRTFCVWTGSTALLFTAAGASLAARRIRILPMNQHARRPITSVYSNALQLRVIISPKLRVKPFLTVWFSSVHFRCYARKQIPVTELVLIVRHVTCVVYENLL